MYVLRRDVIRRFIPGWEEQEAGEPIEMAVLGFARSGDLTALRSAGLADLLLAAGAHCAAGSNVRRSASGFRFTDILVWDTGHMMVNACVTGILPRFRYVLLSDALLESLTPLETAAVFGHEIGHVAHRHFLYFAFFFMGSLGVLSLFGDLVSLVGPLLSQSSWLSPGTLRF